MKVMEREKGSGNARKKTRPPQKGIFNCTLIVFFQTFPQLMSLNFAPRRRRRLEVGKESTK